MRDPHVASLRYRLVPDEYTKFEEPPPLDWDQDGFSLHLEKNVASASMKVHFDSVEKAREIVDLRLRAWELDVALAQHGRPEIHFEFDEAEIVDLDPPPPDAPQVIKPDPLKLEVKVSASFSAHVTRKTYPRPPSRFIASPDAEVMWFRYQGYRDGKEPLAAMAYFCLTVVEARGGLGGGRRKKAAQELNINRELLDKLGELSSKVVASRSARKFGRSGRDYTDHENRWLEAAVLALIRRLGEYDFDRTAKLAGLTTADLPNF